jgi:hypothetical protein
LHRTTGGIIARQTRDGVTIPSLYISVRQGFHEDDDGILFLFAQAEITELSRVHVFRIFGRGPTRNFLAGVIRRTARQDIARVVEMYDLLEALEVTVMSKNLSDSFSSPMILDKSCCEAAT